VIRETGSELLDAGHGVWRTGDRCPGLVRLPLERISLGHFVGVPEDHLQEEVFEVVEEPEADGTLRPGRAARTGRAVKPTTSLHLGGRVGWLLPARPRPLHPGEGSTGPSFHPNDAMRAHSPDADPDRMATEERDVGPSRAARYEISVRGARGREVPPIRAAAHRSTGCGSPPIRWDGRRGDPESGAYGNAARREPVGPARGGRGDRRAGIHRHRRPGDEVLDGSGRDLGGAADQRPYRWQPTGAKEKS
jgi:hypothetical protein